MHDRLAGALGGQRDVAGELIVAERAGGQVEQVRAQAARPALPKIFSPASLTALIASS